MFRNATQEEIRAHGRRTGRVLGLKTKNFVSHFVISFAICVVTGSFWAGTAYYFSREVYDHTRRTSGRYKGKWWAPARGWFVWRWNWDERLDFGSALLAAALYTRTPLPAWHDTIFDTARYWASVWIG